MSVHDGEGRQMEGVQGGEGGEGGGGRVLPPKNRSAARTHTEEQRKRHAHTRQRSTLRWGPCGVGEHRARVSGGRQVMATRVWVGVQSDRGWG